MKAFVLSLILFAIILLAVFLHARYVTNVSQRLLAYTAQLKSGENISATLSELSSFWEASDRVLEWTSRGKELKGIREAIMALQVSYEQNDRLGFAYRTEQLAELAADLAKFETIRFFSRFTAQARASS